MYFKTAQTLDSLVSSKPNPELLKLLHRIDVRTRIEAGSHTVKLLFLTNGLPDASGTSFLATTETAGLPIDFWDRERMGVVAARTRRPDLRPETITLKAAQPVTPVKLTNEEKMAVALVPAKELVKLPGIKDFSLFDRNVRLSAGKTSINRELATRNAWTLYGFPQSLQGR